MIGKTISHYKIIEQIGSGGMGIVYKAEDTDLKRNVALKFLPPELTRDNEARERFVQEAQAASALQHNNICTIHEINKTEDGQIYICMDLYEGETLKDKISQGPIEIDECLNIFSQIAREGRKFKVGLCAITQQPRLIKEEILSQFNTFCILGLADEGDRNILKSSSKQDLSKLEKEIQTLEVGEALLTYPGAPFAIPLKIHWYDEYIKGQQQEYITPHEKTEVDEDFF